MLAYYYYSMNKNQRNPIRAPISYLAESVSSPEVKVFPPADGRAAVTPENIYVEMQIEDVRNLSLPPVLDKQGFELHQQATRFTDFYDEEMVKRLYYPECEILIETITNAIEVLAFDHNVRSAAGAASGQIGVRAPVDAAHVDYTELTGPGRTMEILEQAGRADLISNHTALINLWRPIKGPVLDIPLALCDARSICMKDLIETRILHYLEGSMDEPGHIGGIYSLKYNPEHRWMYVSAMQSDELLLLRCYDSKSEAGAGFTPHTGFKNPACPADFIPRESIEVRTLVVYRE